MESDTIIPIEVELSDTSVGVKEKILNKEGIPPYQQSLFYRYKGLPDHIALYDFKIQEESTLYLFIKTEIKQIFVRMLTGRVISIEAKSTDLIENIKAKILDEEGISIEAQRLVYGRRNLENSCRLSDYHIQNGALLQLLLRIY